MWTGWTVWTVWATCGTPWGKGRKIEGSRIWLSASAQRKWKMKARLAYCEHPRRHRNRDPIAERRTLHHRADRRRHLDRFGYPRLSRPEWGVDQESSRGESLDAAELSRRRRGPQVRVAEPVDECGVDDGAEQRPSRARRSGTARHIACARHPERRRSAPTRRQRSGHRRRSPRHDALDTLLELPRSPADGGRAGPVARR